MKRQIRQTLSVFVVLALAAVGGACSQSGSPTAPSPSGATTAAPTSSGSATIVGQVSSTSSGSSGVNPTGLQSQSSTAQQSPTAGLTVTVSGTGISTTVDSSGQFTLTNVPPGDVTLQFTGPGTNASVTISGVTAGQQLQITVTVAGSSASLDNEHGNGSDSSVEIEGLIGSLDVAGRTMVVNGTTISVPTTAVITHGSTTLQLSDLQVGQRVHVKGSSQSGTVVATQIFLQDEQSGPVHEAEAEGTLTAAPTGTCPTVTFTIGSTTVTTTATTTYEGGACTDLAAGVKVSVKGTASSGSGSNSNVSALTATQISIEKPETETSQIKGSLTAAPTGTCPAVTFNVSGTIVSTTAATVFEDGACTDLAAGTQVEADGTLSGSTLAATKVSIENGKDHGKGHGN